MHNYQYKGSKSVIKLEKAINTKRGTIKKP